MAKDTFANDMLAYAAIDAYQRSRTEQAARDAVGFVEPRFWERSIDPIRHALERFAERAAPPALDWAYLHWALRGLAVAEGRISNVPPPWSRLADSARLYLVIGRFMCLPLQPHRHRARVFQATTAVVEYADVGWQQALDLGCVRLSPPPPRPPDDHAYAATSAALTRQAAGFTAPDPPRRGRLPLTRARRSARAAWRAERDEHRADVERRRRAWLDYQLAGLDRAQPYNRQQRELLPTYQSTWQAVYQQTRTSGPGVPVASGPPPTARPAWWRGPA